MKIKSGSSPYFVIAAVMFADDGAAERCSMAIDAIRRSLNASDRHEFKFNKSDAKRRLAFLSGLRDQHFRYMAIALDKSRAWGPGFQFKESLYKYTARLLFDRLNPHLRDATVILDGCGDREFRRTMRAYLIRHTTRADGESPIKHVTDRESHKDNLLQLADMVVGAVGRSLRTDREDGDRYRSIIRPLELGFGLWPK